MRKTWVWTLGWEDPLEKRMAIYSSIVAWRSNNFSYADDITLMAESEELKNLLRVKGESEKAGLLNIQTTKIMTSG